jgi:hypothetical protein
MSINRPLLAVLIGVVSIASLVGCSESPYPLAKVRGKVLIDGVPLSAGKVLFAPIAQGESNDAGKPAIGLLATDGSFTLTTYDDEDGAIVGEHWVTIFGAPETAAVGRPAKNSFARLAVPQKQTVAADMENEINIQLTSRDVARFAVRKD